MLENTGKPVSKAMLDNGYSPMTAKNPMELTNSKGWKELLEQHLPDKKLLTVHERALDATKIHGSMTEPDRVVEDIPTQLRAVELGYKLKGRLTDGSINISGDKVIAIMGGESWKFDKDVIPENNSDSKDIQPQ